MKLRELFFETMLLEYNRQITANAYGTKLITALSNDPGFLPESMITARRVILKVEANGNKLTNEQTIKIVDIILAGLEAKDPTANKQYMQWIARMYGNGNLKYEDINRGNDGGNLAIFHRGKLKKQIKPEFADINKFKSYLDFENALLSQDLSKIVDVKEPINKGEAKEVFNNNEVRIILPNDETAACYYGQGTKWCTASTNNDNNMFNSYNKSGNLYIFIPKQPTYANEKYQIHLPSGEAMDEVDHSVSVMFLLNKRFGDLRELFIKLEPRLATAILFAPDDVLVPLVQKIKDISMDFLYEQAYEMETSDDYYYEYIRDKYGDDDGDIPYENIEKDDYYLNWNTDVRLSIDDIIDEVDLSPKQLRDYDTSDMVNEGMVDVIDLDTIIIDNLRSSFGRRGTDWGLSDYIDTLVHVTLVDNKYDVIVK